MNDTHKESDAPFECMNPDIGAMIGQYEMGTLSETEQASYEDHLMDCACCRQEVKLMYPIASALFANREEVLSTLKQQGVTFESTISKLPKQESTSEEESTSGRSKSRVVYWSVSAAIVAAAVVFIIGRMNIDSSGRYDPFIKLLPMDNPTPLVLRGTSQPSGQDSYLNGVNAYVEADYKRAERCFAKAVSQSPDQGDWWLILGVCQFLRHDAKSAINSLMEADKLTEGSSRQKARWFLSQSYLMIEDIGASVKLLEWLVTEGKAYSQDARNLLEELRDNNVISNAFRDGPQIISPQGGEIFVFGTPITLEWREPNPEFRGVYEVWLSRNGGLTCSKCLASELSADELMWTWDIPSKTGDHLAFRIEAVDGKSRRLGSVTPEFIISPPLSLMLWDPNRKTVLYEGFPHEIRWAFPAQKPRYYRLELWSLESGDSSYYKTLNSHIDSDLNSWVWENPNPIGEDFLLRLEAVFTDSSVGDFCDEVFSISEEPKVSFTEAEYHEQDLRLQLDWTHPIEKSMRQLLYLKSIDNSQVIYLSNNLNRNRRRWEGDLSGLPEGTYEIFLTVVFSDGNLSGKVGEPIYIRGDASRRGSTERNSPTIEAADVILKQNYPNPFNASTTIEFELTQVENVELKVYNMMGQEVKTLLSGHTDAGLHRIRFDAEGLASGTYIYRLIAGSKTDQKQMVLVK